MIQRENEEPNKPKKRKFVLKSYTNYLYIWSPIPNDFSRRDANALKNKNKQPYYCEALPGTQGQDWITTYVYELVNTNYTQKHIAYVECDYVQ